MQSDTLFAEGLTEETSSGRMRMMEKEKNQAMMTVSVTAYDFLRLPYSRSTHTVMNRVMIMSRAKIAAVIAWRWGLLTPYTTKRKQTTVGIKSPLPKSTQSRSVLQ
jgi:hypothetical protein